MGATPTDAIRSLDFLKELLPLLDDLFNHSKLLGEHLGLNYNHSVLAKSCLQQLHIGSGAEAEDVLKRLAQGFAYDDLAKASMAAVDAVNGVSRRLDLWSRENGEKREGGIDVGSSAGSSREPGPQQGEALRSPKKNPGVNIQQTSSYNGSLFSGLGVIIGDNDTAAPSNSIQPLPHLTSLPPSPTSPAKPELPNLPSTSSDLTRPHLPPQNVHHSPGPVIVASPVNQIPPTIIVSPPNTSAVPINIFSVSKISDDGRVSNAGSHSGSFWLVEKKPFGPVVISSDPFGSSMECICTGDGWRVDRLQVSELLPPSCPQD
ncbi:hypothetical protein P7C70_g6319, partial [Phenoliferia sp. Uapishka_3]